MLNPLPLSRHVHGHSHDFKAWNPKRPKLRFSGVICEIFILFCRDENCVRYIYIYTYSSYIFSICPMYIYIYLVIRYIHMIYIYSFYIHIPYDDIDRFASSSTWITWINGSRRLASSSLTVPKYRDGSAWTCNQRWSRGCSTCHWKKTRWKNVLK